MAIEDGPSAFRYPRGEGVGVELPEIGKPWEIGKGRIVREGSKRPQQYGGQGDEAGSVHMPDLSIPFHRSRAAGWHRLELK